jgi:hypothetical protein
MDFDQGFGCSANEILGQYVALVDRDSVRLAN